MKKIKQFKPDRSNNAPKANITPTNSRKSNYDFKWRVYALKFLKANPTCYCCGAKSSQVDHVRPKKFYPELDTELFNHCPMCRKCHGYATREFDQSPDTLEAKINWINEMRSLYNIHSQIKVLKSYDNYKDRKR